MKKRDVEILDKRILTLKRRLETINENYSCYHEIRQELAAMERIREFIKEKGNV